MVLLSLYFDGSLENLKIEIDKIQKMFGRFSIYRSAINEIKKDIYTNFDKYKNYSKIYIGNIIIFNNNVKGVSIFFHSSEEDLKSENKPLYDWGYTQILLTILLLIFILFICLSIYCYIFNINILTFLANDFGQIFY